MDVEKFISAMCKKEMTLLAVIENNNDLLSEDKDVRREALSNLSKLLSRLPKDNLSEMEIMHCCAYYISKMEDHHSLIPPILAGITNLFQFHSISDDTIVSTLQNLFKNVACQGQTVADRKLYFLILSHVIKQKKKVLDAMGSSFVLGFIQSMEGERDPRNLILCFQTIPLLLSRCDCSLYFEDLFEVLACYFPVDFSPPANDVHKITRDDISDGLMNCLSCSSSLGPYLVPFLLEKSDSDLTLAKRDSLDLLAKYLPNCETKLVLDHLDSLWTCIRREIFLSSDDEVEDKSLTLLSSLVSKLITPVFTWEVDSALNSFFNKIFKECEIHLQEADLRFLNQCTKIISSSFNHTGPHQLLLPKLLDMYKEQYLLRNDAQQTQIANALAQIIVSNKECSLHLKDFFFALSKSDCERSKIDSLKGFGVLSLSNEDFKSITPFLLSCLDPQEPSKVRKECVNALKAIIIDHPSLAHIFLPTVQKIIYKVMIGEFGEGFPVLPTLVSSVCIDKSICITITKELLEALIGNSCSLNSLCCYRDILNNCRSLRDSSVTVTCQVVEKLLRLALAGIKRTSPCIQWFETLSSIMRIVVSSLDLKDDPDFLGTYCKLLLNQYHGSDWEKEERNFFNVRDPKDIDKHRQEMVLSVLEAIFVSCSEAHVWSLPQQSMTDILEYVTDATELNGNTLMLIEIYASFVNKVKDHDVPTFVREMERKVHEKGLTPVTMTLISWLIKALLLRGRKEYELLTLQLIEKLGSHEENLSYAVAGFKTIVENCGRCLNNKCNARVSVLYRQRFFLFTSPLLLSHYSSSQGSDKMGYCRALCCQIPDLPRVILKDSVNLLFPLLMTCLTIKEDEEVLRFVLPALLTLCQDNVEILESHSEQLVQLLQGLTVDAKSKVVRVKSLQCLYHLAFLPEARKMKGKITKELEQCLGDKKRCVRYEAVKTRNVWYLVGSPGGIN